MKTTTVDAIMLQRPCPDYPRERVADLFAGRESCTAVDILRFEIPWQDRIWALRKTGIVAERVWQKLAIECATDVLPIYEARHPEDRRVRECIAAAAGYLVGEVSREDLLAKRVDAPFDASASAAAIAAAAFAADAALATFDAAAFAFDAAFAAAIAAAIAAADADASAAYVIGRNAAQGRFTESLIRLLELHGDQS